MAIKSGYTAEDLAKLGPDVLTRKRLLAEAMLNDSSKQRKIAHPLQGLQQLAETLVNGLDVRKIDKATMTGQEGADKDWSSLFGGASTPSVPPSGASAEISNTAPNSAGGPQSYRDAIASIESAGSGDYGAVGPTHPKLGRALGRYQIMEANIGPWSQEALGRAVTPEEFLSDPKLQDAIFDKKFGSYVQQYGPEGASQAWFAGPGGVGKLGRRDSLGTSVAAYSDKFNRAIGGGQPAQVASLDPSAGMAPPAPMPAPAAQAQIQGPQPLAPPLPPPANVTNAPQVAAQPPISPQGSPAPQQLAQALTGGQAAPAPVPSGPSPQDLAKALSDPWMSDERKQVARMLLGQQGQRQQADYEQQLKMSDPKYRQDLEKGGIELENLRNPKMSPSEQAADQRDREKMAFDREKFDAEVKKGQWQKLTDGRLYNQTTGEFKDAPPPVPGSVAPKMDDISGMRKEIQQLPSYKNLAQAAPIYKAMAETAGRNTKASDLNLVYGLGKIMDPTSVVREGEMVMVKNTASLPDWLQGAIASLNGGAALTPETRQAIMTEAYGRVKGYSDEFNNNMGQYQGIVQRNGINPDDVIPKTDTFEPWKSTAVPAGDVPPAPDGIDAEDWKYLTPDQRRLWQK